MTEIMLKPIAAFYGLDRERKSYNVLSTKLL